jgi:hypothetical protein
VAVRTSALKSKGRQVLHLGEKLLEYSNVAAAWESGQGNWVQREQLLRWDGRSARVPWGGRCGNGHASRVQLSNIRTREETGGNSAQSSFRRVY